MIFAKKKIITNLHNIFDPNAEQAEEYFEKYTYSIISPNPINQVTGFGLIYNYLFCISLPLPINTFFP